MTDVIVVGLSHHTAPIELRERVALPDGELHDTLRALAAEGGFGETVLVSTCNRVEIYASGESTGELIRAARAHLTARAGGDIGDVLYERHGDEAVRHAFRVAASLDSLVVGEPQILGQLKDAYQAACDTGTVGSLLGRCFTRAFAVAKRVRSETGIAEGTVSVSSIAIELAKKIFGDLDGRRALLLGAGEMGEAAAKSLAQTGATLRVVNRSAEKARALALACGGEAREYELLPSELVKADVVITSTSSTHFVLTHELMRDVMRTRRHRPIFLIDIAVPRDVDPRVGDLDGVFLYDVDDLTKVAEDNLAARRKEADAAERIVAIEVEEFATWRRTLDLAPTIVAIRERVASIVHAELSRTTPRLRDLSDDDRRALERMGDAIVAKILHHPIRELKQAASEPDATSLIATTRRLFSVDAPAEAAESATPKADARTPSRTES